MKRYLALAIVPCLLALSTPSAAQSPEERAAARALVAKQGDAVVTVLGTMKVRISAGGREVQNRDEKLQTNATVLDATGLAVVSLTIVDPSEVVQATLSRSRAAAAPPVEVTTEPSSLRFRLTDGREVPAKVVLRDKDLDLAFLRPVDAPTTAMAYVNSPSAKASALDLLVVLHRLPEIGGWQPAAAFALVTAVVDKPRTFYITTGNGLGAPVFDGRGQFVGIVLRMRLDTGDGSNAAPAVVLPADDIREVAKQAH